MKSLNLCSLRDIYRLIKDFEVQFQQEHGLCLNEGMLLCGLSAGKHTSTEIAEMLGLTCSNASKVIKSVESKGLLERSLGVNDKRQMYFSVSASGRIKLEEFKQEEATVAIVLENIRKNYLQMEENEEIRKKLLK